VDLEVRTARNVHDADATLIFLPPSVRSRGTALARRRADSEGRPYRVVDPFSPAASEEVGAFVRALRAGSTLNVAGPRASECPGIYGPIRAALLACRDELIGGPTREAPN
jgi:hypothetical protein